MQTLKVADRNPSEVISKAFYRAADALELTRQEIKEILGLSEATISRNLATIDQRKSVEFDKKTAEFALFFIRVYRSLLGLVGGDEENAKKWFNAENTYLGGTPRRLIQTLGGLVEVANYLDALRGKI